MHLQKSHQSQEERQVLRLETGHRQEGLVGSWAPEGALAKALGQRGHHLGPLESRTTGTC